MNAMVDPSAKNAAWVDQVDRVISSKKLAGTACDEALSGAE
jgi:hypothetical protein